MRSRSDSSRPQRALGGSQTDDRQRDGGRRPNRLYVLGIGPGSPEHLTRRAGEVLATVDAVVGYHTYIELIRPLIRTRQVISTGMTREIQRVAGAIELALAGSSCALVSSGDPGIYAMAGLVLETCQARQIPVVAPAAPAGLEGADRGLPLEIVPGIPALCAGAALLGAPLSHDFAAISLSDLLTPWEVIERRLEAAAGADFVIVLYNPKSKKRTWQLERARQIILRHRDKDTPVGVVVSAMRAGQNVRIVSLEKLPTVPVDMQTTVFIGSRASSRYLNYMITPRGYMQKYGSQARK